MATQGILWEYDQAAREYYWYDSRTDQLVYQNGRRVSRSQRVPRTANTSSQPVSLPANSRGSLGPGSGSPPRNYGLSSRHSRVDSASDVDSSSLNAALSSMNIGSATTRTSVHNGMTVIDARDTTSHVRNLIGTSPVEKITDPTLLQQGVQAHRYLLGTGGGDTEQLFSNYKIRDHGFFSVGRVFLVLWAEPAGETGSGLTFQEASDRNITRGRLGGLVHSKVRRFVVVRASNTYCSALPIATYGKQGVGKFGVNKSEHAIIHTSKEAPLALRAEEPNRGELPMRSTPIRVVPDDPVEQLDPLSRIDFGKVHTVQHNIKARNLGMVHPTSVAALEAQFSSVWAAQSRATGLRPAAPIVSASPPVTATRTMSRVTEERDQVDDNQDSDSDNSDESEDDEAEATRAQQARSAYARLLSQGMTRDQAFAHMVSGLRSTGISKEGAVAEIRSRLSYRPRTSEN